MTSPDRTARAEQACAELAAAGQPVTFTAVAARTGLGRTTLYRNPALRAIIDTHRHHTAATATLAGLTDEIHTLRTALDARVRHHEEQLRRLTTRTHRKR
jgi:Family of unknown function (DUF6262)